MTDRIRQTPKGTIGKNIKALREAKGLRNIDVVNALQARGLDIARGTYSKVELGLNNPSVDLLNALTKILGCDHNAFFR